MSVKQGKPRAGAGTGGVWRGGGRGQWSRGRLVALPAAGLGKVALALVLSVAWGWGCTPDGERREGAVDGPGAGADHHEHVDSPERPESLADPAPSAHSVHTGVGEPTEGSADAKTPASGHEAQGREGVLDLDPEILRDLRLTTVPAEERPGQEAVVALGELGVDERRYAEVTSPVPARVVRLLASPGEEVRRGQPLVELQSVELGQARADHLAARARLELAESTLRRKRGLAAERIVAAGELERAQAEAASAEAHLQAAAAALTALGAQVGEEGEGGDPSRFLLSAPLSGTVLERRVVLGRAVDPAAPLFRVAGLEKLWLTVRVFEADAVRVEPGATALATFAALPGERIRGRVGWVGREVDSSSRTVPVRVDLANPEGRLRPGMFATAWLAVGSDEPVVAVPAPAVQRLETRWVVFVPLGDGRFEVREVSRGRDLGDEVVVLSGLSAREPVVVEGAFLLRAEAEKRQGGSDPHHHH